MAKYNSKQAREEHEMNIEGELLSQKFIMKMTILICSFIFGSVLILSFAFGAMTTTIGIIISIIVILFLVILSGALTRSALL